MVADLWHCGTTVPFVLVVVCETGDPGPLAIRARDAIAWSPLFHLKVRSCAVLRSCVSQRSPRVLHRDIAIAGQSTGWEYGLALFCLKRFHASRAQKFSEVLLPSKGFSPAQ